MEAGVCNKCSLPEELCVCDDIAKDDLTAQIDVQQRQYGKEVTIVKGLSDADLDISSLETELKKQFACGGTFDEEEGEIELQGNHRDEVGEYLGENHGFEIDT